MSTVAGTKYFDSTAQLELQMFTDTMYVRGKKSNLASLAKWSSVRLRARWLWVRVPLQLLKLQISCLFQARSSLTFWKLLGVDSL